MIPFRIPWYGWGTCEDTGKAGACDRASWFRGTLQTHYYLHGWAYQTEWEAHHISQVSRGGGNIITENGVLLAPNLHSVFTTKFEPRFNPVQW